MSDKFIEVLLVEDNEGDRELARRAWEEARIRAALECVEDGTEALHFIFGTGQYAQDKPGKNLRLVLVDLKLPKISGLDVVREIKNNSATKDIPVIVLSSSREDQDIAEAYRLGANGYVVKPINFDDFVQAILDIGTFWLMRNHPPRAIH